MQQHTKWGKAETISPKVRNETKVSTLPTLTQHSSGILARTRRQEKEIEGILTEKEEVK
jgi:hypothetical protein